MRIIHSIYTPTGLRTKCLGIKANKWENNEIIANQNQWGKYNKSGTNQLLWTTQSMCWLGEDANTLITFKNKIWKNK